MRDFGGICKNTRVANTLSSDFKERLDGLLTAGDNRLTPFQTLKQPPGKASPRAVLRLAAKLELIQNVFLKLK